LKKEGGLTLRHPLVVCVEFRLLCFSALLFFAKNAAALGYHGYHINEDIMVLASDIITLAKEVGGWGAISGYRRAGKVWLLTASWSGYPKAPV